MSERAPAGARRLSAQQLAAATPATRNRYADLLRVASIFVVVLGHWTMAVLSYHDGKFVGQNLLEIDPWTHILTWIFQVMPIFFVVGGFTNAHSWRSASERGVSYADWLRARAARLLGPALIFVTFWTFLPILAVALGIISSGLARIGGREVALPIWFLATYLLTVAADGALTSRRWIPWAMAAVGLAGMAVLTTWFDYPVSMIGLTHAERSNTLPPTLALLSLAVWQCGAMLLVQDAANRWLARPRVWLAVVYANDVLPVEHDGGGARGGHPAPHRAVAAARDT